MARQAQVIDFLVEQQELDAETAEKLRSSYEKEAATRLPAECSIDEETLLQHLAIFFDAPPAGYQDGLFIERRLFEQIGPDISRKYEVLPVRRRGDERVDVVVVEPLNDMARQVLEDQLEAPIRQYVWPRIRFLQARHFFFGDELPSWIRPYLREHPVTFGYATPDGEIDVHQALEGSNSLHVHQWTRTDVHEFIAECFDRDTLLKVLLGYAGQWLTNRLIVVFSKGTTQPYFLEDWPEVSEQFDGVDELRDLAIDSEPDDLIRSESSWQSGSPAELQLEALFDTLEAEYPELLVALPIQIGPRNAMSLIGVPTDRSTALRLEHLPDDFDIDPLVEATERTGDQLELMIKKAKRDSLPPPAERIPPLPEPTIQVGLGIEDSLVEQEIARRQQNQKQHRWEIVDISHVIEESSVVDEDETDEQSPEASSQTETTSSPEDETPATSQSGEDVSSTDQSDETTSTSETEEPTNQTSPADGDVETTSDNQEDATKQQQDRPPPEQHESSEVAGVVADALASDQDASSEISGADEDAEIAQPEVDEELPNDDGEDIDEQQPDVGATNYGMPTVDFDESSEEFLGEASSSTDRPGAAVDSESARKGDHDSGIDSTDSTPENEDVSDGWSEVLSEVQKDESDDETDSTVGAERSDEVVPPEAASRPGDRIEADQPSRTEKETPSPEEDTRSSDAVVEASSRVPDSSTSSEDDHEAPSTDESFRAERSESSPSDPRTTSSDVDDEDDREETTESPQATAGLNIPTDDSGVPMAQILRRPPGLVDDSAADDVEISTGHESSVVGEPSAVEESTERDSDSDGPVTGRTMMGVGEVPELDESSNPSVKEDDADPGDDAIDEKQSPADEDSWLDEVDEDEGVAADSRPGGTVQMDAESARTQTFGELLDDMESENVEESSPEAPEADDPLTIPVEAVEELESGPMAVEIEESLSLIDDPDPQKAFAAAEHLATAGASVLPKLDPKFPGRLCVDRYQYTVDTMPPVNEHGAILETLVRIGEPSLAIVDKYIDDTSLECRFYATYLLTELPAAALLDKLRERFFDRDQQTRTLAQNIVYNHRHLDEFEQLVIAPLREVLENSDDDFDIEIAAENLRQFKDIEAVPLLIDRLQGHGDRVRETVHDALREITFQPLAPSPSEWRRWWFDADGQPRWQWLVDAMNNDDKEIRLMAFDEIEQLPGVELDYHPEQPPKLRARAQRRLTEIFENQQT